MKAIFHIHTKYSFDSIQKPRKIVDWAFKNKIDYIFITDHNTISGCLEAKKYAKKKKIPVKVITGSEISTDIGDVIGIFIKSNIKSQNHKDVIKEIRSQGGFVVLPHPYLSHNIDVLPSLEGIDFVEIWNGRTSKKQDRLAKKLQYILKAKPIAGCDAHFRNELSNCIISFESLEQFKNGKLKFHLIKKSKKINIYLSWAIGKMKRLLK